ncbi:MAG: histidine kinase [Defluviimonas sp.]|nr:histidine kinase [Paracoccaceae bacterium]MCC0063570.1 histidine kinase [Defluviimonas sp.]
MGFDFAAIDADGDGKITAEELKAFRLSRSAGLDADGDGLITGQELADHMVATMKPGIEKMAAERIEMLDADGDGKVSVDEALMPPMQTRIFAMLDSDGDGAMSQAEVDAARAKMQDRQGRGWGRDGEGHDGDGGHEHGGFWRGWRN